MSLREGQVNGRFRGNAKIDMSNFTELTLIFTRPDGTKLTVKTADGVQLGPAVEDPKLGDLEENKYFEYFTIAGDIPADSKGFWPVCGIYEDDTTTPPTVSPSLHDEIEILEGCVE